MFDKKIIRHNGAIGFGGGEPTILPEFDKLIDLFLQNGFDNMRVPSSGIKYSKMIEKGISTGQLTVVVSIDSSCRETYKQVKQIDAFNKVCDNLKKYAKAKTNTHFGVISKFIIIPFMNDTETEIDNWLQFNKDNNIEVIVIDIENSWLNRYRESEPDKRIMDLVRYAVEKARKMQFYKIEICDRARYLFPEYGEHA